MCCWLRASVCVTLPWACSPAFFCMPSACCHHCAILFVLLAMHTRFKCIEILHTHTHIHSISLDKNHISFLSHQPRPRCAVARRRDFHIFRWFNWLLTVLESIYWHDIKRDYRSAYGPWVSGPANRYADMYQFELHCVTDVLWPLCETQWNRAQS